MSKAARRIALVSLSPWRVGVRHVSFNLAVRRLQASLMSDPRLADSDVRVFEMGAESLSTWVDELVAFDPDLLGASAYLWSLPTFALLARAIKMASPHCLTVFGGPSARPAMLSLAPFREAAQFIDVLALGEGEQLITDIAANHGHGVGSFAAIPGLALQSPLGWRKTPSPLQPLSIDRLPSPYRMGLSPKGATAYMETYRGCPMSCAFCQWGNLDPSSGVLSVDALIEEFEAMSKSDLLGVSMVDAGLNLNARAFKNLAEAEAQTGFLKGRYFDTEMYPHMMKPEHLEFLANARSSVGLGLQSANPDVLKAVDRPFKPHHFAKAVEDLARVARVTVEVIVGLPGDSPSGFKETMAFLTDLPCNVRVYHCLVLPDALMSRYENSDELRFHPITLEIQSGPGWSETELRDTCEWVDEKTRAEGVNQQQPRVGRGDRLEDYVEMLVDPPWWSFDRTATPPPLGHHMANVRRVPAHLPQGEVAAAGVHAAIVAAVTRATHGHCRVGEVIRSTGQVVVRLDVERASYELVARPVEAGPSFRDAAGCGFMYRSDGTAQLDQRASLLLTRAIDAMAAHVAPLVTSR
ncbi:MAG: B12-binding domain-containing radical SAM protein [Polyangiales bacterium]|nr:radical SAM protein [Sandaracinaceae bacterium]